jgi:F0F1-type ATP synthase assembly protein I
VYIDIVPPQPPQDSNSTDASKMARSWSIALNFSFGVIGMGLLGWAIQTYAWKSSAPWLMLGFLMAGLIGGFTQFIRDALREANAPDEKTPKRPTK